MRSRNPPPVLAAVFMPTTSPWASTSGPPESPGWSEASTRMRFRSVWEPELSATWIVSPTPRTAPVDASGVPPRPPALPSATTASPTETLLSVWTVSRPETPSIFRRATSSVTL